MKYLIFILITVVFTWPAVVVSYIWEAISTGLFGGREFYERHADACEKKFVKKPAAKETSNAS